MAKFRAARGLQQEYNTIAEKNNNTVYFCTDTGNMYLGGRPLFDPGTLVGVERINKTLAFTTKGSDGVNVLINVDLSDFTTEDETILCSRLQNLSDIDRNIAQANILNQSADPTTGKKGYRVLLYGESFASQVTASNTIYEIRGVFDLGGSTVSIPENCTLKFNGGKIKNGILVGTNTIISANCKIGDVLDNIVEKGRFIKETLAPVGTYWDLFNNPENNLLGADEGFKNYVDGSDSNFWEVVSNEIFVSDTETKRLVPNPGLIENSCVVNDGLHIHGRGWAETKDKISLAGHKRYLAICYANIEQISLFETRSNANSSWSFRNPHRAVFYSRSGIGFRIKDDTENDGEYNFNIDWIANMHETGFVPIIYVFDLEKDVDVKCYFGQLYSGYESGDNVSGHGKEIVKGNILHAGLYDISNLEIGTPNYKRIYEEYKNWVEMYSNQHTDIRDVIFSDTQSCQIFIDEMNKKAYFYNMFNTKFGTPSGTMSYSDMYNDSVTHITTINPDQVEEHRLMSVYGTLFGRDPDNPEGLPATQANVYVYDNVNPGLVYEISNVYINNPNYIQCIGFYRTSIDGQGQVVEEYLRAESMNYMNQVLKGSPWNENDVRVIDFRSPLLLNIPPKCNRIKIACSRTFPKVTGVETKYLKVGSLQLSQEHEGDDQPAGTDITSMGYPSDLSGAVVGDVFYKVITENDETFYRWKEVVAQMTTTADPDDMANAIGLTDNDTQAKEGFKTGEVYYYESEITEQVVASPVVKIYSLCELDGEKHDIEDHEIVDWEEVGNGNLDHYPFSKELVPRFKSNLSTAFDLCKLEIAAASLRPLQEIWNRQVSPMTVTEVGYDSTPTGAMQLNRLYPDSIVNNYFRLYGKGGSHSSKNEGGGITEFVVLAKCTYDSETDPDTGEISNVTNEKFEYIGTATGRNSSSSFTRASISNTKQLGANESGPTGNGDNPLEIFNSTTDADHFIVNAQNNMMHCLVQKGPGNNPQTLNPIKSYSGYAYDSKYQGFRKLDGCTAQLYKVPSDTHIVWIRFYCPSGEVGVSNIIRQISWPMCLKHYTDKKWYGLCLARFNYIEGEAEDKECPSSLIGYEEYSRIYNNNNPQILASKILGSYRNEDGYRIVGSDNYLDRLVVQWDTYCVFEGQPDSPLTFFDVDFGDADTVTGSKSIKKGCYGYGFGKNIQLSIPPMSATKTMTAIIALEYLKPTDLICYTKADISAGSGSAFAINDQLTLRDALFFLLGNSDNSIANCICRNVGYRILSSRFCN